MKNQKKLFSKSSPAIDIKSLPDWERKAIRHSEFFKLACNLVLLILCICILCKVFTPHFSFYVIMLAADILLPKLAKRVLYKLYRPKEDSSDAGPD